MTNRHMPFAPVSLLTQYRKVEADQHARLRLFNEIMTGPNPLTPAECARMATIRPEYAFMASFGPKAAG